MSFEKPELQGVSRSVNGQMEQTPPPTNPFLVPCVTCGDPITRVLSTDPATCDFCQRILGKRFDKALEPPIRQPKVRPTWNARLHITKNISKPDYLLSWCCVPVHELYNLAGAYFPDPCTALMMKEDYEEECKYKLWHGGKDAPLRDTRVIELRQATLGHRLAASRERGARSICPAKVEEQSAALFPENDK